MKDKLNGAKLREEGRRWIDRVRAAEKHEKDWLDEAHKAVKAYTNEEKSSVADTMGSTYDYNICYANIETIVPAIINSPPLPDIRRRFGDADESARVLADVYERAMRVQIDESRLQVELEAMAQDALLAGRGVIRVRFLSDIVGGETDELEDIDEDDKDEEYEKEPVEAERLENERVAFEAISWRDYRHGPAKRWEERPWDAFRFVVPKEDEDEQFDRDLINAQNSESDSGEPTGAGDEITGWEIWCKKSRKVKFVRDDGTILKIVDDPLGLSGFFPIGTPAQPIEVTGRLAPVNPFSVYRRLADELDTLTKRIDHLVNQMRVKGWYAGSSTDLQKILELDDNEFAPIADAEMWASHGGLDGAIAFWPVERFVVVIKELYAAREQTKQAIYEITGISDIVRGASKASETATAQNIKSQWGSLRIQKMQRMMERVSREIFVMMSEIIPTKFSVQTLEMMTGIKLIPQPNDQPEEIQKKMAVLELMKQRASSFYRIDVETDSTIRADLTRQKQEVSEFLQGAAAYFQAVAPLVQQGALPADAAVDIFASTARMFNLGKSVEDTLENMVVEAKKKASQPAPEKPNPEMVKAEMEQQKMQAQAQIAGAKAQSDQAQAQAQIEAIQAKLQADIAKLRADTQAKQIDSQTKVAEANTKAEISRQTHEMEMQKGQLELVKIQAEIEKIRAGTAATKQASSKKEVV